MTSLKIWKLYRRPATKATAPSPNASVASHLTASPGFTDTVFVATPPELVADPAAPFVVVGLLPPLGTVLLPPVVPFPAEVPFPVDAPVPSACAFVTLKKLLPTMVAPAALITLTASKFCLVFAAVSRLCIPAAVILLVSSSNST